MALVPSSSSGGGGGGSGTVTNVSSADTSLAVANPTTTPVLTVATLDVLATNAPAAAAVPFNGQKGTGVGNGSAATDIAAFGQIPTALPPNGAAGGDLTGTFPNPTIGAGKVLNAAIGASAAIAYSKLNLASSIVSADIVDGTIVNADINASAAIALAKLADPGAGFVVGSSSGAAAVRPPGFEWDYAQITAGVNITATTEGTSTVVIAGNAVTFDGSPVLLQVYSPRVTCDTNAAGDQLFVCLFESGASIGRIGNIKTVSITSQEFAPFYGAYRFTPSAGAHTYSIACFVTSTTGTPAFGAGAAGVGNLVPAFYRVTKV